LERTRILIGRNDRLLVQLFRYTLVGGLAFLVDFGALYVLTEFGGLHYLASGALAFLLGLATNYLLSVRWVFSRRTFSNRWAELGLFSLVGLAGLGLNEIFLWLLTERIGLHYLASKIVTTVLVYLWNFGVRKAMLFR